VPHLNELHEKWNAEGLTVLAVTGEGKAQTEPWIEANKAIFGYAYDKGGKFMNRCGVTGIPASVLIDAGGKVVYFGSPQGVTNDLVSKAVQGALKTPLYALPKEMSKVRSLLAKDNIAGAIAECDSLAKKPNAPEQAASTAEALRSLVVSNIEAADSLSASGDWLGAQQGLERMLKAAKGMPQEAAAKEKLAAIAKNSDAQKEIKAQKALERILSQPVKKAKDVEELVETLKSFAKKNAGSFAAKAAEAKIQSFSPPK
jgi:hypothetical protein